MREAVEWRSARLRSIRDLTPDIRLFAFEPSGAFVRPSPGSHINVTVYPEGRPDTRSYSIVAPSADGVYRIAVKRLPESRGGSAYMWTLAPGAQVLLSTPGNHFELGLGKPDYLLVAGGIGITPIYTMALALMEAGARFRLLYAVRTAQDLALADELRLAIGDRLELFVSGEGSCIDLTAEIERLAPDGELYLCGPVGLLEDGRRLWQASGRPVGSLHFETFGTGGRFATEAFDVRIPRLGLSIAVPRNRSMLEALEEAGVEMIFDCRRGECGLCALDVLSCEGVIDHRDVFFSEAEKAEGRKLCTCVSRVVGGSITVDTPDRIA